MSRSVRIWVVDHEVNAATLERLGDARSVADRLEVGVGAVVVGTEDVASETLIAHGADEVVLVRTPAVGPVTCAFGGGPLAMLGVGSVA